MGAWIGPLIVFVSVTLYASLGPQLKRVSQAGIPPFAMIAVSMFALFAAALILSIIFERSGTNLKSVMTNKNLFFALITVGLINTLGFYLTIQGYKYMPIWQQNMFELLKPILAGIFAYFILGELITMKLFMGLVIMGIGLYIAVR